MRSAESLRKSPWPRREYRAAEAASGRLPSSFRSAPAMKMRSFALATTSALAAEPATASMADSSAASAAALRTFAREPGSSKMIQATPSGSTDWVKGVLTGGRSLSGRARLVSCELKAHRHALAAADADRRDPAPGASLPHRAEQGDQDARPAGAYRVPEGNGAAADVHPVRRDRELPGEGH